MMEFPELIFSQTMGLWQQIEHIKSELIEVEEAYLYEPKIERLAEELADVIVSCVTALRIITRQHGLNLDDIINDVHVKNRRRGYEIIREQFAHTP